MLRTLRNMLYPPGIIAAFLLTIMCISVNPILAQTETPIPRPTPVPVSAQQLLSVLQQTSQSDGSTVNTSVLFLGVINLLIFAVTILFLWKGGLQPVQKEIVANREAREVAESSKTKLETDYGQERKQFGETLSRAVNFMDNMETRAEAETRRLAIQANSDKNTASINEHTDGAVAPIVETVGTVLEELQSIREDMVTKEHFDGELTEIRTRLDTVITELKRTAEPSANGSAPPDGVTLTEEQS